MTESKKYHFRFWILLILAFLLPIFILLDLTMGSVKIPFSEALNILLGAVIFFILALTILLILDKWASFSKEIN